MSAPRHTVRLVDIDDSSRVLTGEVIKRRGKTAVVRHYLWPPGRPPLAARGKGYWDGVFDIQTGSPRYERAAWRVHDDDVWMLRGGC